MLGVRNGPDHVMQLWMVRRTRCFSSRDTAVLGLVAPVLERLLRQRPTSTQSSLTLQERRVLHHVAAGLTNAEVAERLVVAPCTVRKHLENAYRKLGVTTGWRPCPRSRVAWALRLSQRMTFRRRTVCGSARERCRDVGFGLSLMPAVEGRQHAGGDGGGLRVLPPLDGA